MSLIIVGYGSTISARLREIVDDDVTRATYDQLPLEADRYLFAAGVLIGKPVEELTAEERSRAMDVNFFGPIKACEEVFKANTRARVCVLGSESGITGSYDRAYAGSKAALHQYVTTRKCSSPEQQLVCVSPGIIDDAGMTTRRTDRINLDRRRDNHPKRRFVTAQEVARLIHFLLYIDRGYISNTIIRMNGGEHIK